ncbi:molybdenum cofactor guanylyltransferase [Granulicella tundricola]|uniref:Probable molybdenum cofactor guanylyltransferase n=1 Tax=Granulicella tundricola (strain ATCC BAA-1859 / DSM 23138 / MP5ACTX9) TaxID=1198114 RepID=E8WYT9_GRATM|nr:molybdenum cofactor guanylyltransferase [Granulicella tundricola]ADW68775.1 putative molybdopterin-guanine dinucleotide biosynthesis protein A [Granulicella tundricola MP5ACTX9]
MEVAGFLLAGGLSSRMGRDKALLELGGETLVARGVRTLGEVCVDVAICGRVELGPFGRVVVDEEAGRGPLGGIVAGLSQTAWEWNLFCPVDVPFVPRVAWERIVARAAEGGCVAVMARVNGEVQPLCAAYAKGSVGAMRAFLATGRGRVTAAAESSGVVAHVDFEEVEWFRNANTPEEFAELMDDGE